MSKCLITTAIPYMNGLPHIGHALEIILTDVIVRGRKLVGEDVFFLTGADEHGSKIAQTAEKLNLPIQTMLDDNVRHFQEMNTALAISNDGYIRTTDRERHWPVVQALWMKLVEKGDIYKKTYAGYYCDREERFVTEEELDENKCLIEGGAPTRWTEDENYFFRLSKYSAEVKKKLESGIVKITPDFRKNEMLAMIGDGLEDVSFSRTKKQLTWGIPVPNDPEHVMYVWCDALANYISGSPVYDELEKKCIETVHTEEVGNNSETNQKKSSLCTMNFDYALLFKMWTCQLHVIGKDIARFHCLTWIGMLLSAGINLPKNILVHGFVNDKDGAKMSKSVGNVIDPHMMIAEYGSDTVRLYMTSEVGVGQDLNFSDERIRSIHNDVLANNYGNLVNRVLSLWIAFKGDQMNNEEMKLFDTLRMNNEGILKYISDYKTALEKYNTQSIIRVISDLLNEANLMLNTTEPWKKSGEEKGKILVEGIVYVSYATLLLSPFIPEATSKVMKAMGIPEDTKLDDPISIDLDTLTKPEILFVKK